VAVNTRRPPVPAAVPLADLAPLGTKCPQYGCPGYSTFDDCPLCGTDVEHVRDEQRDDPQGW